MMKYLLCSIFSMMAWTIILQPAPACATVTLNEDTGFLIDTQFPSDPQVDAALSVTKEFLSRIGLKSSPDAAWRIQVRKNEHLAAGEYHLQSTSEGAVVEGADAEGVRCGLMALLHHLGVRWFDPSGEPLWPALPIVLENFEKSLKPSFPYRGLHICGAPDHYDERLAAWMSFHGMNRKLTHVPELAQVGEELKRHGLAPDTTVHSYNEWVPDKKYFESNPEFFSLLDGRRVKQGDGGQLCLSNAEMRQTFIREVRAFLDQHPEIAVIGVCPNDGYGWCECEKCLALDFPEDRAKGQVNARVADFLQAVCVEIQKSHPGVLVGHYSYSNFSDFYHYLKDAPPNLIVSATTARCYRHAIDEAACPINRDTFARLQKLRSKVKHVYIYDYMFYRWDGLPHPQWRTLEQDVAAYTKLGIDGYMTEANSTSSGDYQGGHLALYVLATLLHDRHTNVDALLDDYCEKRFGAAAKVMRSWLTLWENAVKNMDGCLTRGKDDLERLISPELVEQGQQLLTKAAGLATGSEREAVQREQHLFDHWLNILNKRRKAAKSGKMTVGTMEEFRQEEKADKPKDEGLVFLDNTLKIAPSDHSTRARLYADQTTLGIVVECREPEMGKISDQPGNSLGAVYGSENVEIFLRDGKDAMTCYHALVSIAGEHCAAECRGTRWNWAWEGNYKVKVKRWADHWKVFFEIPFSQINTSDKLALTLIRNRYVDGWKKSGVPDGGAFFDVKNYLEIDLPKGAQ